MITLKNINTSKKNEVYTLKELCIMNGQGEYPRGGLAFIGWAGEVEPYSNIPSALFLVTYDRVTKLPYTYSQTWDNPSTVFTADRFVNITVTVDKE